MRVSVLICLFTAVLYDDHHHAGVPSLRTLNVIPDESVIVPDTLLITLEERYYRVAETFPKFSYVQLITFILRLEFDLSIFLPAA